MSLYKKGGFRRMNQMNGDFLTQLKEPLRSEMNRNVLGSNQAVIRVMNKDLDLFYKEKNIKLENIRRKQGDIYGTMLRVHREKKILQRANYKKSQEELRLQGYRKKSLGQDADVLTVAQEKIDRTNPASDNEKKPEDKLVITDPDAQKHSKDTGRTAHDPGANLPTETATRSRQRRTKKVPKTEDPSDTNTTESSTVDGRDNGPAHKTNSEDADDMKNVNIKKSDSRRDYQKTSKVLEVTKNAPLAPIVRERSTVTSEDIISPAARDGRLSPKLTKNTALAPLIEDERPPRELSVSDIAIASVADAQKDIHHTEMRSSKIKLESLSSDPPKRTTRSPMAMPTISEKADIRDIPTRHSDDSLPDKVPMKKRKKLPSTQVAFQENESRNLDPTLAVLNERLENGSVSIVPESPAPKLMTQAEKNRKRAIRKLRERHKLLNDEHFSVYVKGPSGTYVPTLTPFRRKEFAPPSMREKHMQEKMLRAQVEARVNQRTKLESFFERMAQEERERQRLRDAFKKAKEQEAEDARRKLAENEQKLGFSVSQMATMYSRGILPPGVDPASFEAIAYCKYIRTYSPTGDRKDGTVAHKFSSWS